MFIFPFSNEVAKSYMAALCLLLAACAPPPDPQQLPLVIHLDQSGGCEVYAVARHGNVVEIRCAPTGTPGI